VFKNWVLRKVCGSKRDEVTGDWRKLHNDDLFDMYSSPDIISVLKWRRMGWVGHMVQMGKRGMGGLHGTDGENRDGWVAWYGWGKEGCKQAFGRETLRKETNLKTRVHIGR
jgi:hypothetical protein